MGARLILSTAEGPQAIELRPVNSLGRHPSNSIQLLDKIVSKEHCIIELREHVFFLRDLGSLNGTYINNERVRDEQELKHGDEIALGATRGKYDDGQSKPFLEIETTASPGPYTPAPNPSPLASSAHQPPAYARQVAPQPQAPGYPPQPGMPQHPQHPQPHPQSGVPSTQSAPQPAVPPGMVGANAPIGHPHAPPAMPAGYPQPFPGQPLQPGMHPQPGGPGGTAPIPSRGGPPGAATSFIAQGTRIDVNDQARQIGTQINAIEKGFLPYERIAADPNQMRADYERLRLSHELSHAIGVERDTEKLLDKILDSVFNFITADRAVIFLRDDAGEFKPGTFKRRDGTQAPITVSSTILNHVVAERAAVLTHDAAMDFAASKGKSMILNRISSAIVAPMLQHDNEVLGVLWLDSETLARFQPKDLELVQTVANQAARFIEINILGIKIEQEIVNRERFSRLLSPNIAEQVINGNLEVKPGGQRVHECTVFNSDIRGFTRMSESTSPEELVEMLNGYFEVMVDTIFKFDGTLDKFMGDGIMALWGAPVLTPDDAPRSIECALEMADALGKFNRKRLEAKTPPLAVGTGIHTGPVVAGYIGSSKALSYTVIGDTANTSARLCSVALAGQIIVSESTLAQLGSKFEVEELEPAKVKGKAKPLRIYNILRTRTAVQVPADVMASEPTTAPT